MNASGIALTPSGAADLLDEVSYRPVIQTENARNIITHYLQGIFRIYRSQLSPTLLLVPSLRIVAGLTVTLSVAVAEPAPETGPTVSVQPEATLVYDTARDGCDGEDVPDAPARAFRDTVGTVHFFAASPKNRAMLGSRLDMLSRHCDIAYQGAHDGDPSGYSDYGWLTSFYADGNTIYALVHNEFHGHERPGLCLSHDYRRCWENSLIAAVSHDGGYHFAARRRGDALVAALPYRYRGDQVGQFGYFNPTNIVARDGFYYVMFSAINRVHPERNGVCLARTARLDEPDSWRGWDGTGFTTHFVSPYVSPIADPLTHTCQPVGNGLLYFSLGSLLWSPRTGLFVLTMRRQAWDKSVAAKADDGPGTYLAMSRNLTTWSAPHLILTDARAQGAGNEIASGPQQGARAQLYPSLLDPDSMDANFSTVINSALLFTVTMEKGGGYRSWRLWSRRVRLTEWPAKTAP